MLLLLTAFGPPVLKPYLYSGLGQVDLHCNFLAHKDVRVARFRKQRLQNVQLGSGECCPLSPLLSWVDSPHTLRESYSIEPVGQAERGKRCHRHSGRQRSVRMGMVRVMRTAVSVRTVRTEIGRLEKARHQGLGRMERHGANFLLLLV